jgi:hypothetical protein
MREVTTIWCLYLLLNSLFLVNAGQPGPCVSSGTLSWSITQNCTLDTADLRITGSLNVAALSLEGAVAGELSTVLLSGPPLSGVLSAHHNMQPSCLSSKLPSPSYAHLMHHTAHADQASVTLACQHVPSCIPLLLLLLHSCRYRLSAYQQCHP